MNLNLNVMPSLRLSINDSTVENECLREMVQEQVITMTKNGTYTDEMKIYVLELLTLNVPTSQIGGVIESVMKLAHCQASHLPCRSTINDWNAMRLIMAQKHLSGELTEQETLGLLSDETSKFGLQYEGYHVADEKGRTYILGLRDIASKSGQDALSTFQQILQDIENVSIQSKSEVSKDILLNIKSTMSDRAATQIKFNTRLEEYIREVLPQTVENYEQLTEDERRTLGTLCNFFLWPPCLSPHSRSCIVFITGVTRWIFESPPIYDKSFLKQSWCDKISKDSLQGSIRRRRWEIWLLCQLLWLCPPSTWSSSI